MECQVAAAAIVVHMENVERIFWLWQWWPGKTWGASTTAQFHIQSELELTEPTDLVWADAEHFLHVDLQ